jgi:hypothetical protein
MWNTSPTAIGFRTPPLIDFPRISFGALVLPSTTVSRDLPPFSAH